MTSKVGVMHHEILRNKCQCNMPEDARLAAGRRSDFKSIVQTRLGKTMAPGLKTSKINTTRPYWWRISKKTVVDEVVISKKNVDKIAHSCGSLLSDSKVFGPGRSRSVYA